MARGIGFFAVDHPVHVVGWGAENNAGCSWSCRHRLMVLGGCGGGGGSCVEGPRECNAKNRKIKCLACLLPFDSRRGCRFRFLGVGGSVRRSGVYLFGFGFCLLLFLCSSFLCVCVRCTRAKMSPACFGVVCLVSVDRNVALWKKKRAKEAAGRSAREQNSRKRMRDIREGRRENARESVFFKMYIDALGSLDVAGNMMA